SSRALPWNLVRPDLRPNRSAPGDPARRWPRRLPLAGRPRGHALPHGLAIAPRGRRAIRRGQGSPPPHDPDRSREAVSESDHDCGPHFKKLLADVERVGWHVVLVRPDEEGPGFGYTVGVFKTFK